MEIINESEFSSYFQVLLEVFDKRDDSGKMTELYWNAIKITTPSPDEFSAVMGQLINDPPPKLPSAGEIKGLLRQLRISKTPFLPAAKSGKSIDYHQFRQNRIALLRGIYNHQGDTKFYRAMLQGNAGLYAAIATSELSQYGLTIEDLKVTHEDVSGIVVQPEPLANEGLLEQVVEKRQWLSDPILRMEAIEWAMQQEGVDLVTDDEGFITDLNFVEQPTAVGAIG